MSGDRPSPGFHSRRRLRSWASAPRSAVVRLARHLMRADASRFHPDFDAIERFLLELPHGAGMRCSGNGKQAALESLRLCLLAPHRSRCFVDAPRLRVLAREVAELHPSWRARTIARVDEDRTLGLPIYGTKGPVLRTGFPWGDLPRGPGGDVLHAVHPHRYAFCPRWALAILYGQPLAAELLGIIEDWMRFARGRGNQLAYLSNLVVIQRLLATSWAWAFLSACEEVDEDHRTLELRLLQILVADLEFLAPRLGRSYPNNHLLLDRFAAWFATAVWPEFVTGASTREELERAWLCEWQRQTLPDGGSFEHSQHYHELACEMAVAYVALCRRNGWPVSQAAWDRTRAMLRFQIDANGPHASPLAFGNGTDDPLFPLDSADGWACAALQFVHRAWFGAVAQADAADRERAYWLLGGEVFDRSEAPTDPGQAAVYPDAGVVVLPDRHASTRLVLRTGPAPGRALCAGHANADLLCLYADVDGMPFLVDSGTYTYRSARAGWPAGEPDWRRYFAGPRAHNGLAIGDSDPLGDLPGDFREPELPVRVELSRCHVDGPLRWVEGVMIGEAPYTGYRRGAIHVRDEYWLVYDVMPESTTGEVSFGFQAAPEALVERHPKCGIAFVRDHASLAVTHGAGLTAPLILRGRGHPPAGWVSRHYGCKEAAHQARYAWTGEQRLTAFVLTAGPRPRPYDVEALLVDGAGCAFRLRFEGRTDLLLASDRDTAAPWSAFGLELDGDLAWWSCNDQGAGRFAWACAQSLAGDSLLVTSRTRVEQMHGRFDSRGAAIDSPEVHWQWQNDTRTEESSK